MTFAICELYESYRKRALSGILGEMIKAVFIGMAVLMMGVYRNILIVGSKHRAKDIIDLIRVHSYAGLRVSGCLEVDEKAIGQEVASGVSLTQKILWTIF